MYSRLRANIFFICNGERRCPRTDAPAAEQAVSQEYQITSRPRRACARGPEAGNARKSDLYFSRMNPAGLCPVPASLKYQSGSLIIQYTIPISWFHFISSCANLHLPSLQTLFRGTRNVHRNPGTKKCLSRSDPRRTQVVPEIHTTTST
jgi:hypothetical protein